MERAAMIGDTIGEPNGWFEKMVSEKLGAIKERADMLTDKIESVSADIVEIKVDVAKLQVKIGFTSAFFGILGGGVAAAIALTTAWLKG